MERHAAEQIDAFLAVMETGSFTAAGRRLGRDASVVSRRIAALEARLGIRVLERSTRRVSPTEAGARLRDRLREAEEIVRSAEDEARSQAAAPSGTLRVSLPRGFGRLWIAPRMPDFLARHPAVEVFASYTDRYVDLIAESFDAGVRIGGPGDTRLVGRRVATMRRVVCASPALLARVAPLRTPDDLARVPCIGFTPLASHPVWHFERGGRRRAVRVAGPLVCDDIEAVVQAGLAGVGVILATDWLVGRELKDGRLAAVLPAWQVGGEEAVSVVRPSLRHESAKTRAFVDWMAGLFTPAPWA